MNNQEYIINDKKQEFRMEVEIKAFANQIVKSLIAERKRQGLTQQEIADITGMKAPNVTRIESCKFIPTLEVLMRYAKAVRKEICFTLEEDSIHEKTHRKD